MEWLAGEIGDDRVVEKLKRGAALLGTSGQDRPDALAPPTASFSSRPLRDLAVDGEEPDLPLGAVVGRFDAWRFQKSEVGVAVIAEPLGDVLGLADRRRSPRYRQYVATRFRRRTLPALTGHLLATVPRT